ncbi:two-component system response regulator RssB [Pantoea eucrina]|uniref:Regulator of RpoS n=1 Tax=Pantoea eucrina TaxID=472693 RepID=A0ABS1Z1E3_9GAMM|nr:two-component system response regulator RssB [Pantoea eucrina]AIX51298.1 response regulator of RpoS [Pantoea sp. PSNIH1]MBM0745996.1 two-component system response regulator RssB [Pantoea eucrina]PPS58573.1 response regulator [Pantoea sp. BRM17]UBB11858.1 two-component system response regulator RssB [Pantoea eucrina]
MEKPLLGKKILIVEDEVVFRSLLENVLTSLGATALQAGDGLEGLDILSSHSADLVICDLEMPRMGGIAFVEHLRSQGNTVPVLVISATQNMADIAHALRLGVQDVLLKPLKNIERFREAVFECLYPSMFTSKVEEDEQLFQDWDALARDPIAAAKLLKQLQPPVQQTIAHCRINYRQLTMAEQPGLVLDIAALSDKDLAFYCLDVTRAGDNGVLAALLLRALFNGLLQEQLSGQHHRLPELNGLLRQVNMLLRQANLTGQFPLLVGYYHRELRKLILVSAGLNATLHLETQQLQLNSGVPLGTMGGTHLNQISQHTGAWQCHVWGAGGRLRLMLSGEE